MSAVFPEAVAEKLKNDNAAQISEFHPSVTILFADVVNFAEMAQELEPEQVVETLNQVFSQIDNIAKAYGVEKIKTIGDAFMGASGLEANDADHLAQTALFALALRDRIGSITWPNGRPIALRIGLNAGPVIAGVIGKSKPLYDIWGHTVNIAARLESSGVPGEIRVTVETAKQLGNVFEFSAPGALPLKGSGALRTLLLVGKKPPETMDI